jgi:hypothetical protein
MTGPCIVKLFLHSIAHLIVNRYSKFQSDSFDSVHVSDLKAKLKIFRLVKNDKDKNTKIFPLSQM